MRKFSIILLLMTSLLPITSLKNYLPHDSGIFVSDNGWLKVQDGKLKNSKNKDIVLKGLSSHGIQWYSDLITYNNLKSLKDDWQINVFRIAIYTDENGYIENKDEIKKQVIEIANHVISLDMYVILDWHILKDNNPNQYKEEAKTFFHEFSTLYKDCPNVIYEICNEPNGEEVTWKEHVKPYAEEIIPIIRKNSPNSLIIVGTPNWCMDLSSPADNPLNFSNVLYSCHFYSGSHDKELQDSIDFALAKKLPVFVSEWGTTDASGSGEIYLNKAKNWINFLNDREISWVNWSFSNKNENSAIIDSTYIEDGNNNFNDFLTQSGKFIKSLFNTESKQ